MSFGKRLESLIGAKNLNHSSFAKIIGENRQRVSHIIATDNSPNYSLVDKILTHFPDLSAEWLCRGNGSMWLSEMSKTSGPSDLPVSGQKEDADISWKELVGEVKQLRADLDKVNRK